MFITETKNFKIGLNTHYSPEMRVSWVSNNLRERVYAIMARCGPIGHLYFVNMCLLDAVITTSLLVLSIHLAKMIFLLFFLKV